MDSQLPLPVSAPNIGHASLFFSVLCHHKLSHPWVPIFLLQRISNMSGNLLSLTSKYIPNPNILHPLWSRLIPRTTIVSKLIHIFVFLSIRVYSWHKSQSWLGNTLRISTCWVKEWWEGKQRSIFGQREKIGYQRVSEEVTQSHKNLWNCNSPLSGLDIKSGRAFSSPWTTHWI